MDLTYYIKAGAGNLVPMEIHVHPHTSIAPPLKLSYKVFLKKYSKRNFKELNA